MTIVYPLPAEKQRDALLGAGDLGRAGAPLLSAEVFENGKIPDLDERSPLGSDAERLAALRAVAVRLDPCPGVVMPPPAGTVCEPQIRLIFQALQSEQAGVRALDGAIHGFYRLTRDDFAQVLDALRKIRAEDQDAPEVPLNVHPRLRSEGPDGAYGARLKALVTQYTSTVNLVRVTHFRRTNLTESSWEFAIRDFDGSNWGNTIIATTNVTTQTLTTVVGGRWDADITPLVTHEDNVTKVFKVSPDEAAAALTATVRVLNPRVHSSESLDCASCHIAPDIASFAHITMDLDVSSYEERFKSTYSTEAVSKSNGEVVDFENVHLLSYAGGSLSVSQRVANETAAVLELINDRSPAR